MSSDCVFSAGDRHASKKKQSDTYQYKCVDPLTPNGAQMARVEIPVRASKIWLAWKARKDQFGNPTPQRAPSLESRPDHSCPVRELGPCTGAVLEA